MAVVDFSGEIPASMAEGSRPGDWAAMLTLTGKVERVVSVEAIGPGAAFVDLRYDPTLDVVFLTPGAVADYEAFIAASQVPEIVFSLRFHLRNGVVREDTTQYRIALLDKDDSPPSALGFSSGGSVAAGAIGATIGTLAVSDTDSTGPFTFHFAPEDEWRFEVVGNTLKLRDGVSLGLDDMPSRPLLIEVSDGHNSAGFTLDLTVTDPGGTTYPAPVMVPGELRGPVALATAERAVVLAEAHAFEALRPQEGEALQLVLHDGTEVLLPAIERVEFTDGVLELDPQGAAAQAAALHLAMHGTQADGATLGQMVAALQQGSTIADLAAAALDPTLAAAGDEAFVAGLYRQAMGREADPAELALQLGRLASGTSRAQLAVDIALDPEALAHLADINPYGFWVALPPGRETPDMSGGHDLAPWDSPADVPADFSTDLLLF